MQIVGDGLILLKSFLPAVALNADDLAVNALGPSAEVVNLAANLLLPGTGRVGRGGNRDRVSSVDLRLSVDGVSE